MADPVTTPSGRTALSLRTARRLRWALPVGIGATVAAVTLLPGAASAGDAPTLPARTAAQLLADLQSADVAALSGTVVETARLGLPEIPSVAGAGTGTGPLSLATGSTTVKVWYDGAERQRIAMLGQLAEYDAVHAGRDLWTYTSEKNAVAHVTLPAAGAEHARPGGGTGSVADPRSLATPQAAAEAALRAVDPTTSVTVDRTARVAGRAAYQLVLAPKGSGSLVASVQIALDAATSTPLRVQVWGTGDPSTPAFEVGFTDVSFSRPDAAIFAFTPPPGATVKEAALPADAPAGHAAEAPGATAGQPSPTTAVTGTGWSSVLTVRGVDPAGASGAGSKGSSGSGADAAALLDKLTTRVPEGRVLRTALLSALLTDDGRLLVGAVPPERLQELAR